MVKFHKGDRVKALVNGIDYKVGDEFVLTGDGDGKSVYFDDKAGDDRIRPQEEFELLPVAATGTTESQPATLTIEAGKFYRTRDGRKVGPMVFAESEGWLYVKGYLGCWHSNGKPEDVETERSHGDLIAEWVDEPVAVMQDTNDDTPPVAEQQVVMTLKFDATEITESIKSMLVRTKRGYGFEIARHGDYVWVDTGLHAPIAFKAANVHAA